MVDVTDTLEGMATRLAQWFDADDPDRLPPDIRYWCINEARKDIIRNNDLRWGNHLVTLVLAQTDYQLAFDGGTPDISRWQKPIYLWYYDSVAKDKNTLEHVYMRDYDKAYPDPTDASFEGEPTKYATDGDYLYFTPADGAYTLNIRFYGLPADLAEGSPDNTDNYMVNAASAIFWTAMGFANDWFPGEERREPIWIANAERFVNELVVQERRNRTVGMPPVRKTPGHANLE